MTRVTTTSQAMNRLLAAALLCLAIVFAQLAHAAPAASHEAVAPFDVSSSLHAGDDVQGHAGVDETSSSDHEHEKEAVDGKCASHCPSVFVAHGGDRASGVWSKDVDVELNVSTMTGSPVPTGDRPPRA